MKKNIFTLLILLLLTTGCSCEYNLIIDNNNYKEEIKLIGEDDSEINNFNNEWEIPIDKIDYNRPGDPDSYPSTKKGIYNYNLSGKILTFTNNFSINEYSESSAVSVCYKQLTVEKYNNSIIISSSSNITCFDNYPTLNSIKINVKVDKPVTSNNADSINGNIYTWILNKGNSSKPINLVLDNNSNNAKPSSSITANNNVSNSKSNEKTNKYDRTMYILLGILLIIILLVYFIFNKIKNKSDKMDD